MNPVHSDPSQQPSPDRMTAPQLSALKRLERYGDPESDTNRKLREAVQVMVDYIVEIVQPQPGPSYPLPGGYGIDFYGTEPPHLYHISGHVVEHDAPLVYLQQFSAAVASGLIVEIERQYKPRPVQYIA